MFDFLIWFELLLLDRFLDSTKPSYWFKENALCENKFVSMLAKKFNIFSNFTEIK